MEPLACIDHFDFNDPAFAAAYGVDGMHADRAIVDKPRHHYEEINLNVGYDFGIARLAGRVRFSPNSFGNSGNSWNKRTLLSVPLPFLNFSEDVSFKAYGSIGNFQVERFLAYGIPSSEYWQVGLITTAYGLDFNLAYTDTSIEPSGCGHTNYCAGRFFVSVTKVF